MRALPSPITKLAIFVAFGLSVAVVGVGFSAPAAHAATVTPPPINGQFDYQIGGAYTPADTVDIVSRDRAESIAANKYNICYLNAFQTQPEEASFWTGQHSDLLLKASNGSYAGDPDWPGEYILDTSTAAKRTSIATIVNGWIDGCKAKGYQAIEPDNLDTFTRFSKLTKSGNLALAALLATHAHDVGLAIAQKNTTEVGAAGKSVAGFDFAIAEECQVHTECDSYTDVYGDRVIEIEYTDNARSAYTKACKAQGKNISVILRDRFVVTNEKSAYRYEYC